MWLNEWQDNYVTSSREHKIAYASTCLGFLKYRTGNASERDAADKQYGCNLHLLGGNSMQKKCEGKFLYLI